MVIEKFLDDNVGANHSGELVYLRGMKNKTLILLVAAVALAAGCVQTRNIPVDKDDALHCLSAALVASLIHG